MMSKQHQYATQIDKIISKVNNIKIEQLKKYGFYYIGCYRHNQYLIITSIFDCVFLANMNEIYSPLKIRFPNKVFLAYAVLVIDLQRSKYVSHRLYTFVNNLNLYGFNDASSVYKKVLKQIEENKLEFEVETSFRFSSKEFDSTVPISSTRSYQFDIKGSVKQKFSFEAKKFCKNHISFDRSEFYLGNKYASIQIIDPYYYRIQVTKEQLIKSVKCTCRDSQGNLAYGCFSCVNKTTCKGHHIKKCRCGKFTYHRKNTCLHCHLKYTKSKALDTIFKKNNMTLRAMHTFVGHLPYLHYNQGSSGLCLGHGAGIIDGMISRHINPVRLMLSFKANLSFTDANNTARYYNNYKYRLSVYDFEESGEFYVILNDVFRKDKLLKGTDHVLSLYCYCPSCFFFKIVLWKKKYKLHDSIFQSSDFYIVSRDQFIELYKTYLRERKLKSKTYQVSYIHEIIKTIVNYKPKDLLEIVS